jgi:uncharacterized protein (TIGR00251 family)
MKRGNFLEPGDGACRIWVDVSPGAAGNEIVGVNEWRKALQVKIAAEPRDGAANEELISFLSAVLGVARRHVRIVRGERSSMKLLEVPLPVDEVRKRLEG